jgi:CHAD domain-containing protein
MATSAPEGSGAVSGKENPGDAVPSCRYGFRTIRKAHQALVKVAEEAALKEDPEHVHRMRVASRRLRASMPIFKTCFPKKKYRKWYGEIRGITAALGTARDLDVQIAFLEEYHRKYLSRETSGEPAGRERSGIPGLLRRLKRKRNRLQAKVEEVISSLAKRGIYDEFDQFISGAANVEAKEEKPGALYRKAHLKISSRIDRLLALESSVRIPDAVTRHHQMRIAAKKLRYTLEVFNRLFSGEFKKPLRTLETLQDVLGQIHDCDVWIADLQILLGDNYPKQEGSDGDTAAVPNHREMLDLLNDRTYERDRRYHAFVEMWEHLRQEQFFENLQLVVSGAPPGRAGSGIDQKNFP